ncbi:MAG: hypothetical protein PHH54_00345 [Candidatus Nanoarchaeia archaeon]|nr:hypothetical protein [Candidatus Nanoarchaeia archaeon]MDD5740412.1 hypothetical protein [Candidatus Nanoarchaeia archaeon]
MTRTLPNGIYTEKCSPEEKSKLNSELRTRAAEIEQRSDYRVYCFRGGTIIAPKEKLLGYCP